MDYAAARETFFAPPPDGAADPQATTDGSPARRLRDAQEPIATQPIWSADAHRGYAELGLDFLTGYVAERSAALGADAPTSLVVSAFGVFSPALLGGLYEQATAAPRDAVLATRTDGPARTVRAALDGVPEPDVADVVGVLRVGLDAADANARPLFAGLSGRAWPADIFAQLVHATDLLREHRGDSHLALCAVAGLDPIESNILTELYAGFPLFAYTGSRGWPEDEMGAAADRLRGRGLLDGDRLAERGVAFREQLEAQTDHMQRPVIEAIGPDLEQVTSRLADWGNTLVRAGLFPPDPAKRAAG